MSLLISLLSKLSLGKSKRLPLLLLLSNGFSSSLRKEQTPPCYIVSVEPCEPFKAGLGKLEISRVHNDMINRERKVVRGELVYNDLFGTVVTIGASNGWVATLNGKDGILRLQDDLNPYASYTDPKRIPLPPLVTLPRCQTQIVTNVSMSSSSPEDEDCVVAVKFLGPQLSFCRPAQSKPEWVNIRIDNPCFYSSRVMFSKKDKVFRILGAGGHLMGSWDLQNHKHKIQRLHFENIPELTKPTNELMDSCCTYEHLVESDTTGETFMLKQYKKTGKILKGVAKMKTRNLMVFKLDNEGNAVYTGDIGDLVIFLSKSEPFCVPASSLRRMLPNCVETLDSCENGFVHLDDRYAYTHIGGLNPAPFFIPPQNID
ncbi:hypothetical protein Rs2_05967 [Raphanus sativus]|uniref:Uncharacterized protein LOC108838118 n=1 Tax=Raphanus sativus TaxID=3726 RepID=A0A6J0M3K7_RAPSA|nr:uncharacterized protein LOC108838118 [Raphanus sativus]KAJ4911346.1 hypothetical protein Rs2_05967 [Raphanus sativus]